MTDQAGVAHPASPGGVTDPASIDFAGDPTTDPGHLHTVKSAPGSLGVPSPTVVGPDTYGAPSAPGTSLDFSCGDHNHGLPAAPISLGAYSRELGVSVGVPGVGITSRHNINSWAVLPDAVDTNTGARQDWGTITSEPIAYGGGDAVALAPNARWDGLTLPFAAPFLEIDIIVANPAGTEYFLIQYETSPSASPVVVGSTEWGSGTVFQIGSDLTNSDGTITTTAGGVYVVSMTWGLQW